jgi:hypothetical protein
MGSKDGGNFVVETPYCSRYLQLLASPAWIWYTKYEAIDAVRLCTICFNDGLQLHWTLTGTWGCCEEAIGVVVGNYNVSRVQSSTLAG